jgi:uncharacterized repeat protein (TIGR01451 family)
MEGMTPVETVSGVPLTAGLGGTRGRRTPPAIGFAVGLVTGAVFLAIGFGAGYGPRVNRLTGNPGWVALIELAAVAGLIAGLVRVLRTARGSGASPIFGYLAGWSAAIALCVAVGVFFDARSRLTAFGLQLDTPTVTFNVDSLSPGGVVTQTIVITAKATRPTVLTNTALVLSSNGGSATARVGQTVLPSAGPFTATTAPTTGAGEVPAQVGTPKGPGGFLPPATAAVIPCTSLQESPQLLLSNLAPPTPSFSGEEITYTLKVTNTTDAPATGIAITDTLPKGSGFVRASEGGQVVTTEDPCAGSQATFTRKSHNTLAVVDGFLSFLGTFAVAFVILATVATLVKGVVGVVIKLLRAVGILPPETIADF